MSRRGLICPAEFPAALGLLFRGTTLRTSHSRHAAIVRNVAPRSCRASSFAGRMFCHACDFIAPQLSHAVPWLGVSETSRQLAASHHDFLIGSAMRAMQLKQTAICCSFRAPPEVAQSDRGCDLGKREAERRCTWGIPQKLQQIAVCFQGDVHAAANRRSFAEQRLRYIKSAFVCRVTFTRLRNDVYAAAYRRLCRLFRGMRSAGEERGVFCEAG